MKGKDLVSVSNLSGKDIGRLLKRALELKGKGTPRLLQGRTIALVFQKPSHRTRVSFDVAMYQLGGHAIYLSQNDVGLGSREPPADIARVLSRYVDGIVARTYSQRDVEVLAETATVPVINALSDEEHPCQALGDLLTALEKKGRLEGLTLAFIGDGNNVAASLALAASLVGMSFRIASPHGYGLPEGLWQRARNGAGATGASLDSTLDPREAARDADIVYTDVWVSMGQEGEAPQRRQAFAGYCVTPELMSLARPDALFMHPLPAHRGEEVSHGMLEHPSSAVFDQAENRLHIQKAILAELLGQPRGQESPTHPR